MDFDLSKENIQPLRGGRNVAQLEVALQAQTNIEFHRELLHQKEEFETAIRNYEGDDPLDNWYHYVQWVEQSYPKHGHEGNLVPLLEHCLGKFENDKRYTNDRRFCKLWIKYIDLQQNPLELYQMMYARELCRGCADLYRAWAYYHEAVGDFHNANIVFEYGKRELAQPYDELELAHSNLFMAAGQHVLIGTDERRLQEKRQALTSLLTYKPGKVGSIRTATGSAGILPANAPNSSRSNAPVPIYEDHSDIRGAGVAPASILSVAKSQDAPKENTLKPGPWTTVPVKKRHVTGSRGPAFTVHEDSEEIDTAGGLRLPENHPRETMENYSSWNVALTIFEPVDNNTRPMYPKSNVYSQPNTEFCLEELRAVRYLNRSAFRGDNMMHEELVQRCQGGDSHALQVSHHSIYQQDLVNSHMPEQYHQIQQQPQPMESPYVHQDQSAAFHPNMSAQQQEQSYSFGQKPYHHQDSVPQHMNNALPQHLNSCVPHPLQSPGLNHLQSPVPNHLHSPVPHASPIPNPFQSPVPEHHHPVEFLQQQSPVYIYNDPKPEVSSLPHTQVSPAVWSQEQQQAFTSPVHQVEQPNFQVSHFNIWNSPSPEVSIKVKPKGNVTKFAIYEQSSLDIQEQIQPRGSAMKTPFKELNVDDIADTGSSGSMDVAAAAQPPDSARRLLPPMLDESSGSSFEEIRNNNVGDLNATCDTQMFNFNLNVMRVSTPQQKQVQQVPQQKPEVGPSTKKQLFADADVEKPDKALSTILEETKSFRSSSSSSSGAATKSSLSMHSKHTNMGTISEEHNSYLVQNLMANAALRTSLLGDLMDFNPPHPVAQDVQPMQDSPIPSQPSSPVRTIPPPTPTRPLDRAPSDPFKPPVIRTLLDRVNFPGVHTQGYCQIPMVSRLKVSKELTRIGNDSYFVEKQLGKGTFGTVFKAQNGRNRQLVALKYQKPANKWEFYICRELQARLVNHELVNRFMDVTVGYFSDQASILVSEYMPCGSLLDLVNSVKQKSGKTLKESLCIYFCLEMLRIVEAMHRVQIIHADIKPDNFLIQLGLDSSVTLQLIDFGCSIDMSLFPPGSSFTRKVNTEDFICCEMRDGRPWNYHTDMFCIAATAHVLLFDKYIQLQKKEGHWSIMQRLPRYMRLDLWNMFFSNLLNQQAGPADSQPLQAMLEDALNQNDDLQGDLRYIVNILRKR